MRLIGTIANDWTIKHGVRHGLSDELLREWRDYLEDQLSAMLDLDSELSIGTETRFSFSGKNTNGLTITEIDAFARKALDRFLHRIGR